MQKLWEELATLPAVFPDGRPLYARADPWLFNDLVRAHFVRLKKDRPFLSYFQQWISILLAWWVVPITLLLFWGRYLPRHDTPWTIVLAVLLAISIVSAIQLYRLAKETLAGCQRIAFTLKEALKRRRTYNDSLLAVVLAAVLIVISEGTILGSGVESYVPEPAPTGYSTWIPKAMNWFGYSPFANLRVADVSIKPADWRGRDDEDLSRVRGVILTAKDLRFADAGGAFLVKAFLARSDLHGAYLMGADLRQAVLVNADLSKASFLAASLQHADLKAAHLNGAVLTLAHLDGADFRGATLQGAFLLDANLTAANFSEADLTNAHLAPLRRYIPRRDWTEIKYADFRKAKGLNADVIKECKNWELAFFDPEMLNRLGLLPDNNEAVEAYRDSQSQEPFDSWAQKWREEQKKAAKKK